MQVHRSAHFPSHPVSRLLNASAMTTCAPAAVAALVATSCLLWHQTLCHNLGEDNKTAKNGEEKFGGRYLENSAGIRDNTVIANGGPSAAALASPGSEATSRGDAGRLNDTTSNDIIDVSMQFPVVSYPFPLPAGVVAMFMNSVEHVTINFTLRCSSSREKHVLEVVLEQQERHFVARLAEPVNVSISCSEVFSGLPATSGIRNMTGTFNISIISGLLGKGVVRFFLTSLRENGSSIGEREMDVRKDKENSTRRQVHQTFILVLRQQQLIDDVFRIATFIIVGLATVCMGCKTDLAVVRDVLKKPFAPAVGFVSQYVAMPLIAYGLARTIQLDNPAVSFGIFTCGVCPGGGMSNLWSHLLGGDISLSVTMTTISTIAALGMLPLWLFTLGETIDKGAMEQLKIPYLRILQILALIIVPLFVGIFIRYRLPRVQKVMLKVATPFCLLTVLFFVTVGIYANRFVFDLFEPLTILAGCLLPYIGYIIGGIFALICRQPWFRVKTIAIETGVQNVGVAFLILLFSLPPPDGELAAVGPAASALMTPLPIFVITLAYMTYNKCSGRPLTGRRDQKIKDTILQEHLTKEMEVVTRKMVDDTD